MTQTYNEKKQSLFLRAEEVCELMEVSPSFAYKVIKDLNKELADKGYIPADRKTFQKTSQEAQGK